MPPPRVPRLLALAWSEQRFCCRRKRKLNPETPCLSRETCNSDCADSASQTSQSDGASDDPACLWPAARGPLFAACAICGLQLLVTEERSRPAIFVVSGWWWAKTKPQPLSCYLPRARKEKQL